MDEHELHPASAQDSRRPGERAPSVSRRTSASRKRRGDSELPELAESVDPARVQTVPDSPAAPGSTGQGGVLRKSEWDSALRRRIQEKSIRRTPRRVLMASSQPSQSVTAAGIVTRKSGAVNTAASTAQPSTVSRRCHENHFRAP